MIRKNSPSFLPVKELHRLIDDIDDHDIKTHQAARWYSEKGFHIVPFLSFGYPSGLSQHHATNNIDKIDEWWHPTKGRYAGASIAMAHGGKAGFCAVDLDVKDADGIKNLAELHAIYGEYEDGEGEELDTLMAFTPSGGRHLVFKFHPEIISNSQAVCPGIDTRGGLKRNPSENGGITFVEPSRKPNNGGSYRWSEGTDNILEMPEWLVDILNGRTPVLNKSAVRLQDSYVQSAPGLHGDGRDRNIYMDLLRFVGIGYTEEQLWGLMPEILQRMDPPDERMVADKINSVLSSDAYKKAKEDKTNEDHSNSLQLIKNSKGKVIHCVRNLEIILESAIFQHEYGLIQYDDFTQSFLVDDKPMASVVDWAIGVQSWISKKFKVDFGKTEIRDKIEFIAYDGPHVNTARNYMLNCLSKLDCVPSERDNNFWGSNRLGPGKNFYRLCYEVLSLNDPELHEGYNEKIRESYEAFLWFWMRGVAARACVPACKMEIVLNIFGAQGIGKSMFFLSLCPDPDWFTDSIQDTIVGGLNNRDELMKLHSRIIVEMPELNPIKRGGKSEDDRLKQFISARVDSIRRPYGHDIINYPRTCALAGTSNNRDVYRDSTGARRFTSIDHGDKPIRVGDLDQGLVDEIRDKVWAEVVSSFTREELDSDPHKLNVSIPPLLRTKQFLINDSHRFEEIGINDVIYWMADKSRITWDEIVAFSRTVPGLRDAKESIIISQLRKTLNNDGRFVFKRRCSRHNAEGEKEITNYWLNKTLQCEQDLLSNSKSPPHWSEYTDDLDSKAEY